MTTLRTIAITALVPCVWGSTFVVTTELLPENGAFTNASIRAMVAGLLLLLITRELPKREWYWKTVVAGALNFSIFWWLLFEAAYRLPGGVAATVGAIQPLFVYALAVWLLKAQLNWRIYSTACFGVFGVALLAITPDAAVDPIGVSAAIGGALSMAVGVVLTKRWQMPVSPLSFASWQLIVGGILLLPVAVMLEEPFAPITTDNFLGHLYLGVIGGALTYAIWFKGISRLGPVIPTTLGFFSPLTAIFLGWLTYNQTMTTIQVVGAITILCSVITSVWLQTGGQNHISIWKLFRTKLTNLAPEHPSESRKQENYEDDPFSHPELRNLTLRETADLPIDQNRIVQK